MKIYTSEDIAGHKVVESLGLVRGNTIRARGFGHDILAGLRNLIGGEIKDYTDMLSDARNQALDRMIAEAEEIGADAIISVRFTTSQTMGGAAEILAYGTAVKIEGS